IVGVDRAVGQRFAHRHPVSFINDQVPSMWNQIFANGSGLFIGHNDLLAALGGRPQLHDAGDFRDNRGGARAPRFKELDHARKTASDILGLGDFLRDFGYDVALADLVAVFHVQVGIDGQRVADHALSVLYNGDLRMQTFGAVLDDHALGQTRDFVLLLVDGNPFNDVFELHRSFKFADDG